MLSIRNFIKELPQELPNDLNLGSKEILGNILKTAWGRSLVHSILHKNVLRALALKKYPNNRYQSFSVLPNFAWFLNFSQNILCRNIVADLTDLNILKITCQKTPKLHQQ